MPPLVHTFGRGAQLKMGANSNHPHNVTTEGNTFTDDSGTLPDTSLPQPRNLRMIQ